MKIRSTCHLFCFFCLIILFFASCSNTPVDISGIYTVSNRDDVLINIRRISTDRYHISCPGKWYEEIMINPNSNSFVGKWKYYTGASGYHIATIYTNHIEVEIYSHSNKFIGNSIWQRTSKNRLPQTTRPTVYLTFDDGPLGDGTKNIIDVLEQENISATFFIVGVHAERNINAQLLNRILQNPNFTIANHTYTHAQNTNYELYYASGKFTGDIDKNARFLQELSKDAQCHILPNVVRLPGRNIWNVENYEYVVGGLKTYEAIKAYGYFQEYNTVYGWDVEWHKNDSWIKVLEQISTKPSMLQNSCILLLHDAHFRSTKNKSQLVKLVRKLKELEYDFQGIEQLM